MNFRNKPCRPYAPVSTLSNFCSRSVPADHPDEWNSLVPARPGQGPRRGAQAGDLAAQLQAGESYRHASVSEGQEHPRAAQCLGNSVLFLFLVTSDVIIVISDIVEYRSSGTLKLFRSWVYSILFHEIWILECS